MRTLTLLLSSAALFTGCDLLSDGGGTADTADTSDTARDTAGTTDELFVVDEAGGEFEFSGVRIVVPAGALDRETTIALELLEPPAWAPEAVTGFVGINPEPKIHFLGAPITLEIPDANNPDLGSQVEVWFIEPADAETRYEEQAAWMATDPISETIWNDSPDDIPEVAAYIDGYDPTIGWAGEDDRVVIEINQLCYIGIVPVGE